MKLAAQQLKKGFTLIELLVVIGILGILAAALIATIDPFEQLNKADDATTVNVLTEYQNALLRYYANKGLMPWEDDASLCAGAKTNAIANANLGSTLGNCVTAMVLQSELKPSFTTATAALNKIILNADTDNNVTMCFIAKSKSQQRNQNSKYTQDAKPATNCLSQTNTGTACYWCTL